jgi:hypothetical protein
MAKRDGFRSEARVSMISPAVFAFKWLEFLLGKSARMLESWPGGKKLLRKKHRPIEFQISNCGFRILKIIFFNPHSAIYNPQFRGPARAMKWKLPHAFCVEVPYPRAWHPVEGRLRVAPQLNPLPVYGLSAPKIITSDQKHPPNPVAIPRRTSGTCRLSDFPMI